MKNYFKAQLDQSSPVTEETIARLLSHLQSGGSPQEYIEDRIAHLRTHLGERKVFALVRPDPADKSTSIQIVSLYESEIKDFLKDKTYITTNACIPQFQVITQSLVKAPTTFSHHKQITDHGVGGGRS